MAHGGLVMRMSYENGISGPMGRIFLSYAQGSVYMSFGMGIFSYVP